MTDPAQPRIGVSFDVKPHAYDPLTQPELFEGVMARRIVAFVIDVAIIVLPVIFVAIFILLFGLVTLGLGWFLLWFIWPGTIIWGICYYGLTFGGRASATIGMRVLDLELRTWYGGPAYFVLGAVHGILFWLTTSFLTPLILIVGFLNERQRLLHDMLVGAVVINNPVRAEALRRDYRGG
jgi:uncharacterized RDD family membrane protein YckC